MSHLQETADSIEELGKERPAGQLATAYMKRTVGCKLSANERQINQPTQDGLASLTRELKLQVSEVMLSNTQGLSLLTKGNSNAFDYAGFQVPILLNLGLKKRESGIIRNKN